MSTNTSPAVVRVIGSLPKSPDLECHVRVLHIDNVDVVEFRDYIPSLQEYGRGYWMPLTEESLYGLSTLLNEVAMSEIKK